MWATQWPHRSPSKAACSANDNPGTEPDERRDEEAVILLNWGHVLSAPIAPFSCDLSLLCVCFSVMCVFGGALSHVNYALSAPLQFTHRFLSQALHAFIAISLKSSKFFFQWTLLTVVELLLRTLVASVA